MAPSVVKAPPTTDDPRSQPCPTPPPTTSPSCSPSPKPRTSSAHPSPPSGTGDTSAPARPASDSAGASSTAAPTCATGSTHKQQTSPRADSPRLCRADGPQPETAGDSGHPVRPWHQPLSVDNDGPPQKPAGTGRGSAGTATLPIRHREVERWDGRGGAMGWVGPVVGDQ